MLAEDMLSMSKALQYDSTVVYARCTILTR